jgi:hypothetical protein
VGTSKRVLPSSKLQALRRSRAAMMPAERFGGVTCERRPCFKRRKW